jgi:hypothetical protein
MIVGIDTIRSDDGGHRGTGGGGGEEQGWIVGEGEYLSKYETLCMVADRGVSGHRGAGRCMYVHGMACMCGISTISASLTSFLAAISAPFSKSREQMSLWPFQAA